MRKLCALFALALALTLGAPQVASAYYPFVLLASAARTTTGTGSVVALDPLSGESQMRCVQDVTAASGTTPTLNATIRATFNGVTFPLASFSQKTAVSQETITVAVPGRSLDVSYTIGGTTPSFTFSIQCWAV